MTVELGDVLERGGQGLDTGGFRQTVAELRTSGLEIVFVFDSTGSMSRAIVETKTTIVQMLAVLHALAAPAAPLRVGVVAPLSGQGSTTYGETIRQAALLQNDPMMQTPVVCDIGANVWKVKETMAPESEVAEWGSLEDRALAWEAVTASAMITAGADMLIMRHPGAAARVSHAGTESNAMAPAMTTAPKATTRAPPTRAGVMSPQSS